MNPDELPAWLWMPGAALACLTYLCICWADARERLRRLDAEYARLVEEHWGPDQSGTGAE